MVIIVVKKFPVYKSVQWVIRKRDWIELLYLIIQMFNISQVLGGLKNSSMCLTIDQMRQDTETSQRGAQCGVMPSGNAHYRYYFYYPLGLLAPPPPPPNAKALSNHHFWGQAAGWSKPCPPPGLQRLKKGPHSCTTLWWRHPREQRGAYSQRGVRRPSRRWRAFWENHLFI